MGKRGIRLRAFLTMLCHSSKYSDACCSGTEGPSGLDSATFSSGSCTRVSIQAFLPSGLTFTMAFQLTKNMMIFS